MNMFEVPEKDKLVIGKWKNYDALIRGLFEFELDGKRTLGLFDFDAGQIILRTLCMDADPPHEERTYQAGSFTVPDGLKGGDELLQKMLERYKGQIILTFNNYISDDPCAICGTPSNQVGLDYAHLRLGFVCNGCAQTFGPEVVAARDRMFSKDTPPSVDEVAELIGHNIPEADLREGYAQLFCENQEEANEFLSKKVNTEDAKTV